MILRNQGQALVGLFVRLITTMGGLPSTGTVSGIKYTLKQFSSIAHSQGIKGMVLYLKTVNVLLQHFICGHVGPKPTKPLVKVTGHGIPKVFPASFRKGMLESKYLIIRLSTTLASLYRDSFFTGKAKLETITDESTANPQTVLMLIRLIPNFLRVWVRPYMKNTGRSLISGKFSYFPINRSSPQASSQFPSSHPTTMFKSATALTDNQINDLAVLYNIVKSDKGANPIALIKAIRGCIDKIRMYADQESPSVSLSELLANDYSGHDRGPFNSWDPRILLFFADNIWKGTGKLGFKQEAAGKVRVFAMIDPWSQWILYPFHKVIFSLLSKHHHTDGTFDQLRPLKRIENYRSDKNYGLYSMDLSSATDRLPISIQTPLISALFGLTKSEGLSWTSTLIGRFYHIPLNAGKFMPTPPFAVKYATGQPMGGYSS